MELSKKRASLGMTLVKARIVKPPFWQTLVSIIGHLANVTAMQKRRVSSKVRSHPRFGGFVRTFDDWSLSVTAKGVKSRLEGAQPIFAHVRTLS
jgi:hypothetical protein